MNINNYIKKKIIEYINLLKDCGYIKDDQTLNEIYKRLNSLKIEIIHNAPGDATVDGNTLKICWENIEKNINQKGTYYIDEVLFHEFSHVLNSFHNAIFGDNKFIVRDYIQGRMNPFTTIELLEQGDELLYNQDSWFGIILLDEFIAQSISQKLVIEKFKSLDEMSKRKYVIDNNLFEYKSRNFITKICEPPMMIKTSLADYPEFDIFAQNFITKYGYNVELFIVKSLDINFVKDFINSLNSEKIEELYKDLCYLGLILKRVYLLRGFRKIDDEQDPALNPNKVHSVMCKILKQ